MFRRKYRPPTSVSQILPYFEYTLVSFLLSTLASKKSCIVHTLFALIFYSLPLPFICPDLPSPYPTATQFLPSSFVPLFLYLVLTISLSSLCPFRLSSMPPRPPSPCPKSPPPPHPSIHASVLCPCTFPFASTCRLPRTLSPNVLLSPFSI